MKAHQFDVITAGGGIIGLAAALAMAERNFKVALIDAGDLQAKPIEGNDIRVYAINYASQQLFQRLGAWDFIEKSRVSPYQHMHVWDAFTSASIDFDARLIASTNLGAIIEESVIKNALFRCLVNNKNITLFPNNKIIKVTSSSEEVKVVSVQQTWHGQLLLATDGGNSPIRQMLNVPVSTWPYHQHALVATVNTEKSHQHTAYQVFNQDGPLAFLPLSNEHTCSIVWSTTPKYANHLISLTKEKFNHTLSRAFAQKLGKVEVISERYQFPLIMRHAKRYAGKNWLLMGDAAHTIHPLAGLGLNVGLADVATWLNYLDQKPGKNVTSSQLAAYQRNRKHAVWQIIALMGSLKTLFLNPLPPMTRLRGLGLTLCNQLTPLKRLLIEQATGSQIS